MIRGKVKKEREMEHARLRVGGAILHSPARAGLAERVKSEGRGEEFY